MSAMASSITSLTIVYWIVYPGGDQRKHESSASLAFVRGRPVNSPHKGPVTQKMLPFDDVIMTTAAEALVHTVRVHICCPLSLITKSGHWCIPGRLSAQYIPRMLAFRALSWSLYLQRSSTSLAEGQYLILRICHSWWDNPTRYCKYSLWMPQTHHIAFQPRVYFIISCTWFH